MPSNKKRLYIALYPSGVANNEERKYHWAFILGPKDEKDDKVPGIRFHVKNTLGGGWVYEELPLPNVKNTNTLLARVLIAKVENERRLVQIFRNNHVVQNDPDWRCRSWVSAALSTISRDGSAVGTARLDWQTIETVSRDYVGKKTQEGRYQSAADLTKPRPTYDLLEDKEIVS